MRKLIYAILILELGLSGCRSLKQKRSQIKPLIIRLHKEFNVSCAEIDKNDIWNQAVIACAMVCNERGPAEEQLNGVLRAIERNWREIIILNYSIRFL